MSKLRRQRLKLLFAAAALCVSLTLTMGTAYAADPVDLNTLAEITIQPRYDGDNISADSSFDIYRVADAVSLSPLRFSMLAPFDGSAVDINAVKSAAELRAAARTLDDYTGGVTPVEEDVQGGESVVLPLGVYLVINTDIGGRYELADPFLLFVPYRVDETTGDWDIAFTVYPKVGYDPPDGRPTPRPRPSPTPSDIPVGPPTPPPDVQTGMLQWPIPVFSGLGLLCIGSGAATLRGKKKNEQEEE